MTTKQFFEQLNWQQIAGFVSLLIIAIGIISTQFKTPKR